MSNAATMQSALYRNRKRRNARAILQSLTPWRTGLVVTAGQYVSSDAGTSAFVAQNSATTGATAPTGLGASDGAVTWVKASIQSLLKFQFTEAPTP